MPLTLSGRYTFVWAFLMIASLSLAACAASRTTKNETAKEHATIGHTKQETAGLKPERTIGERTSLQVDCPPGAPTNNIQVDSSLNVADEARLVAISDNVFLGRVSGKIRNVPPSENSLPSTEFAVKVEKNIKGSLSGTVTVVQGGGCDPRYGRIALINNDPLLEPGEEAVFITSKDSPDGPYSLVSYQSSHVRAETEEQEARIVARFQEAKKADR